MIAEPSSRDFRTREDEAWLRRVQMALNTQVQGDLRVESLGEKILGVLVKNLDAQVGAVYVTEPGERLRRVAGYALDPSTEQGAMLRLGEGLTGQAAKENHTVHLRDLPEDYLRVASAAGRTKSRELVIAPASILEPKGAKIEIARNGREALEHLRQHPGIDLVLMDIMMPVMDGLEATREIRKKPQFAKLPIIALTAKAMIDDREKCLEAGANDYIAMACPRFGRQQVKLILPASRTP